VSVPVEVAQTTFFTELSSYLAARIAGVRWFRSRGLEQLSGGGASGPSDSAPVQKWKAQTQNPGLSFYYTGTHAVRGKKGNYLTGLTTRSAPLDVFLPMGTLLLGADCLPGGEVDFDEGVVTVPSNTPVYNSKRF
jgi:hypothetical protein